MLECTGGLSALLAIGLFSLEGGAGIEPRYELTAPVFDEVIIKPHRGDPQEGRFVIRTVNNAPANRYIQSARLNGKELNRCWITHREVAGGGVLELRLGSEPNTTWGATELRISDTGNRIGL